MVKKLLRPYSYFFYRLANTLSPEGRVIHSHVTGLMILHHFSVGLIVSCLFKVPLFHKLYEAPPIVDIGSGSFNGYLLLITALELVFFEVWYRAVGKVEGIRKRFENETEQEKEQGTVFNVLLVLLTILVFLASVLWYLAEFTEYI